MQMFPTSRLTSATAFSCLWVGISSSLDSSSEDSSVGKGNRVLNSLNLNFDVCTWKIHFTNLFPSLQSLNLLDLGSEIKSQ